MTSQSGSTINKKTEKENQAWKREGKEKENQNHQIHRQERQAKV
jgi:hypothetical protein